MAAVQFTRQNEGIAGALKKIGGLAEGSKLASSDTEEVAHMRFGDCVDYLALFATHPPLIARIQRMQPAFRAHEFKTIATAWSQPILVGEDESDRADVSIAGFAPARATSRVPSTSAATLPAANAQLHLSPKVGVGKIGNPGADDRGAAQSSHAAIPQTLCEAAWQSGQAICAALHCPLPPLLQRPV